MDALVSQTTSKHLHGLTARQGQPSLEELSSICLSGLVNPAGLEKILLMQSSAELTHIYVESCMWCYLVTSPNKRALQFWLMRRKDLAFVCHTNWPVSNQPHIYLHMEESSKLRNVVLIPWVSNKRHVRSFTQVQRSVSCRAKGGILLNTYWSSLQVIRRQHVRVWGTKHRCMRSWPLHEKELNKSRRGMSIQAHQLQGDAHHTRQEPNKHQVNILKRGIKLNGIFQVSKSKLFNK